MVNTENEFSQIKERYEKFSKISTKQKQSSNGMRDLVNDMVLMHKTILLKAFMMYEYCQKIEREGEEAEEKGIYEKPTNNIEIPNAVIDEIEDSVKELEKLMDTCQKQLMLTEVDINSFPTDLTDLKNTIQIFSINNPSYRQECEKMLKEIKDAEHDNGIFKKILDVDHKIYENTENGNKKVREMLIHMRNSIFYENQLRLALYNENHPDEAPKE